jgi:hypothetical protein
MGSAPTGWIVPKLQQHVLALPFVTRSEKLKSVLAHPAGPFTSACCKADCAVAAAAAADAAADAAAWRVILGACPASIVYSSPRSPHSPLLGAIGEVADFAR